MTPHREGRLTVLEQLYNRKHKCGRSVVKHMFGILKQSFRELMKKSELNVTNLQDVVMACCYLHNVLLEQDPYEVEWLMELLQIEGLVNDEAANEEDVVHVHEENAQQLLQATHMQEALEEYLGRHRNLL
jgi:hypothetical protein